MKTSALLSKSASPPPRVGRGQPTFLSYFALTQPAAQLLALADRVARLNPSADGIGAGMLASLVADARRIVSAEQPGTILLTTDGSSAEQDVERNLRAAIQNLAAALQAAEAAGYGHQFRDSVDHTIDQAEVTLRMLA